MTEATVASVLDRLVSLAEGAGRVAMERGPEAMNAVGAFLQLRARVGIVYSLAEVAVFVVVAAISWWAARQCFKRVLPDEGAWELGVMIGVFIGALSVVGMLTSLPKRDDLISAWSPEAALMMAAAQRLEARR